MKKFTLYGIAAAAILFATSAIAQVLVDKTKLREWNGGKPTTEQLQQSIERNKNVRESRAKYRNVVSTAGPARIAQMDPEILPNDVIDDGTRIMVNVVNWWMGDFIGIGSMRPVANTPVEAVATGVSLGENAVYADGKMYGLEYSAGGGQVLSAKYNVYNTETWELEKSIRLDAQWYSVWTEAAYNTKDGKIYVLGYSGMRVPYLAVLDTETGIFTPLVECYINIKSMTFDKNGTLYAVTRDGELETVDLSTGLGTPLFRIEDEGVICNYWHSIAFDHHTGELFWIRTDDYFTTDLRKINLDTRTVEIVSDLPDFGGVCAWVVSPEAPDKAPSTVEKLFVDFGDEGGHIGTINITAPSVTFDGSALEGDVTVYVTVDGTFVGDITLAPGAAGTIADVDFHQSGEHKVIAIASGDGGDGPAGSIIAYCGPDTPSPADNVNLEIADDGTATLKWDAPTGGIHQGYFNADLLTYDIVRYPGEVAVADGIKETSFTETLPNDLDRYYYTVTVKCDGIPGDAVESNSLVYGDGMTIPFYSELGGEEFFNLCTIYDFDGDEGWYETWGSASCAMSYHDEFFQANDWYITPPIALTPGNYFVESVFAGFSPNPAIMDFTFGSSQKVEDHKVIASFDNLDYDHGTETYRTYISVDKEGKYYFGYNYKSTTTAGNIEVPYLTLRTLKAEQGPDNGAPEVVTAVSATPAELGKLETTIKFTTPTTTFNGEPLTALDRVEICDANDEVVGTVSPVEPGKSYEFVHENAAEGYNTYHLYACNDAGRGKIVETEVYAGNDLADMISWLDFKVENNRVVTFEWGAPSTLGIRGGYVNPDDVTYNFCRSEYDWLEPFAQYDYMGLTERNLTWTECQPGSTFGTAQHMYLYGITPVTPLGEGRLGYTGIILGDPCQAPFIESFAGGYNNTTGVWANQIVEGSAAWSITTGSDDLGINPSDDDYGMMLFNPQGNSFHAVILPLIELRDMKSPVLVIDMYHSTDANADGILSLQISKNDESYALLGNIMSKSETAGWTEHKISLKNYNDCNRLFIAFAGLGTGANSAFAVDNIRVCDDVDYDIALESLSAPATMDLGETAAFKIKALGKGLKTVDDFDIDIYADGVKVASASGSQLAPGATVELTANVTTNAANAGKNVVYEARVNHDADGNDINDTASATVKVGGSALPTPTGLTGTPAGDNMELSWTAPAPAESEAVNESFENFTSFAINGENDWKFIDGDQLHPYGISGIEYPNMAEPRAWMVWVPGEIENFADKAWFPNEGSKCLIAFASTYLKIDGNFDFSQLSDEWLISPHVVGGTELKFMACAPSAGNTERFEVLVSYGSRNPEDFSILGETVEISETGWKQYTYQLPADAAYFAIRYVSEGWAAFALLIDNIEFTAGYDDVELIGYNVYVNGERVNDQPVDGTTASATFDNSKDNTFGVSAVYYEGESEMVTLDTQSGINTVTASTDVKVTASRGEIAVDGAEGLDINIYTTMGVNVAALRSTGHDVIPVQQGIYIVNVAGKSFKVIVK